MTTNQNDSDRRYTEMSIKAEEIQQRLDRYGKAIDEHLAEIQERKRVLQAEIDASAR
jgi:hypothetical protein